ncbi:MAG: hypothetical protein ACI3Y2_02010 [Candidatus Egerieousia sp.]
MKGFVQLTENECIYAIGGKDASISTIFELLGYGLGRLIRYLNKLGSRNTGPVTAKGIIII